MIWPKLVCWRLFLQWSFKAEDSLIWVVHFTGFPAYRRIHLCSFHLKVTKPTYRWPGKTGLTFSNYELAGSLGMPAGIHYIMQDKCWMVIQPWPQSTFKHMWIYTNPYVYDKNIYFVPEPCTIGIMNHSGISCLILIIWSSCIFSTGTTE